MKKLSPATVAAIGAVAMGLVAAVSLGIGVYRVPLVDVAGALGDLFHGGSRSADGSEASTYYTLVTQMRLPRAVGAMCVGAALGVSGCMLQALLRNPLASPFIIGTAQGAGFGAVLAIFFGFSYLATIGCAFGMSLFAAFLVLSLARTQRSLPTESVVLTGLAISLLFGGQGLIGIVRYLAHDEGVVGRISLWILGGLWQTTWTPLAIMGPVVVVAIAVSCLLWRRLDLLALGESDAARLGVKVQATGTIVLVLTCVMTSLAICIGGVVAFVGLVVPHAARKLVGPGHAALMPACAFLGAILVIVTDTLARTAVPPQELPLSVVTSLIGVPCFLVIMRSLRARRSGL